MNQPDPFDQTPHTSCPCSASTRLSDERRRSGRAQLALIACQSRLAFLEAVVEDIKSQNIQLRLENQRLVLTLHHLVPWARIDAPATGGQDVDPPQLDDGQSQPDTESEPQLTHSTPNSPASTR